MLEKMRVIPYRESDRIALEPEFVTFSSPGESCVGNHWRCICSTNQIKLEVVLADILPGKEEIIPVERVLRHQTEYGWHFHLSWKQLEHYEQVMANAGGSSAYERSKRLIP